jgi:ketosteroid isomerase-like protein
VAIDARERAYRLFRERADAEGAARTAAGVANDLLTFRSDPAVAAGWLQGARRGLEDRPGSPVIAWLDIVEVGSPATRGGQGYRCHDWVMSNREEFLKWVRSVLWDAEVAIHNGDAGPRRAIWSRNDPVTVLGAWKNASGQQELDELFAHLAESFSDCTSYEFELLEAEVLGDAAYTVGFEHTSASVNGVPRTYTLRATQIYRREDDAWKVAHRHGSAPPE